MSSAGCYSRLPHKILFPMLPVYESRSGAIAMRHVRGCGPGARPGKPARSNV